MSTNRGIFDTFPQQPETPPAKPQDSPFAVAPDETPEKSAPAKTTSPFSVIAEETPAGPAAKSSKIPEPRPVESPFQVADAPEGFGFEASPSTPPASPFESAAPPAPPASPFSEAPAEPPASPSPFSTEPAAPTRTPKEALAAFSDWNESATKPKPAATEQPKPAEPAAVSPPETPAAPAPETAPAPQEDDPTSDSASIRQLELRAIFGVDREMSAEEILQRSRALPGMKNIARVNAKDMATIEALKTLVPNLGFGSGTLKLYAGSVPIDFIREKSVMLAVQTDGGFAPGVRETLMIVARELHRLGDR